MSDLGDLVPGIGGGLASAGAVVGLLKWFAGRSAAELDKTLHTLASTLEELRKEVQALRETHVGFAKDVGQLMQKMESLEKRQDGMSTHWQQEWRAVLDRIAQLEQRSGGRKGR